jgi:hypothetical protein
MMEERPSIGTGKRGGGVVIILLFFQVSLRPAVWLEISSSNVETQKVVPWSSTTHRR